MVNPFLDKSGRNLTHVLLGQLKLTRVEIRCDIVELGGLKATLSKDLAYALHSQH